MVLNQAVRPKDWGVNFPTIPNPANTYLTLQDATTGIDGRTTVQVIRDGILQNVVAYLTSGATAEWVSGAYAKATAVHYTDPAKLVSGTYVAGAAVTAGVVPPASPWLLSALDGKDGVSAVSTITTTRPNVPAVGSDAIYSVGSAAGYGIGMYVDIVNASATSLGTFLIVGITTTSLTLRNVTAIATTTVSTGFTVVASGKPGTNGTNGTSAIATASAFTQPAVNANVNVTVNSSVGFVDKQPLFHNLGGYYKVSGAPSSATTVTLQNLGYAGNIAAAASVGAGTLVPSGLKGADASGSGHTIQEEGVSLTQRSKLNFVGASAAATDDAANDATVITLTSSGGATGIKYTFNTAAGTPTAGEIRSTDLSLGGTIAISATDATSPGKSAADILAKIKVGAIIVIAKSQTEQIRATVTTDYTVGSGSFAVSTPLVDGAIGNGAIVFLSIASDVPSSGLSADVISATASNQTITIAVAAPRSGFWEPATVTLYRDITNPFVPSAGNSLGVVTLPYNDVLVPIGTKHYRALVTGQAGEKAPTNYASALSATGPDPMAGLFTSFWKLNETSGNRADSIGANTITPFNSPTSGTGLVGNALYVTNSASPGAQCLEADNNSTFSLGVDIPLVITAAVYMTSTAGFQMIFSKYDNDGAAVLEREWYLVCDSGNFSFGVYDTSTNTPLLATLSATANAWVILTGWFDPVANTVSLSANNGTPNVTSAASTFSIRTSAAKVRIGCAYTSRQYGMSGRVDCVGFGKTVPTTQQRTLIYNGGSGYEPA
jgi:hypothetical protein